MAPLREISGEGARMGCFASRGAALEWRGGHEKVRIEPWGRSSLRVRGTVWQAIRDDLPGALQESAPAGDGTDTGTSIDVSADAARISHGGLSAEISRSGQLRFLRADGRE